MSSLPAPLQGSSMLAVGGNISQGAAASSEESAREAAFQATSRRSGVLKAYIDEVHEVLTREGDAATGSQVEGAGPNDDESEKLLKEAQAAYDEMTKLCKLPTNGEDPEPPKAGERSSSTIVDELAACTDSLTVVGHFVQSLNGQSTLQNKNLAEHYESVQTALGKFRDLSLLMEKFDNDHQAALKDLDERAASLEQDVAKIDSGKKDTRDPEDQN